MEKKKNITILIVEDHVMFRESIRFILSSSEKYEVIGVASNGREFLDELTQRIPDIVLMDIDMPVMNGIDATQEAILKYPDLKVLALSMHGDHGHYKKMIEAGAKGFVLKSAGINQLSAAIDEVANGNVYFSQELLMNIILKNDDQLTGSEYQKKLDISDREMEVLKHMCKGLSNKQIADELFISIKTVEGHKSKLMLKTETNSAVSLVLFAIKNKLIEI
ncbi:MAG: response regulator transcription factor [Prolixibacteraceae bacterium]|nr:response regulator transcription factor [Prolixibacteraceae bacterium]